ncbi:hypothetical protein HY483_03530 [Candidatus Woesearchaeota archaeon]|nr:hypothetical protein [Candidatus Woesearchaeota archaeon]
MKDLKEDGFKIVETKQVWGLERLIVARRGLFTPTSIIFLQSFEMFFAVC